jgi:hypothetical protein
VTAKRSSPGEDRNTYLKGGNFGLKTFIWTKAAEQIITKVRRGRVVLETAHQSRAI